MAIGSGDMAKNHARRKRVRGELSFKNRRAVKINGANDSYYPSTTAGTFFGGAADGKLFVEGKFNVTAAAPINRGNK